jgi:hypothetical protein
MIAVLPEKGREFMENLLRRRIPGPPEVVCQVMQFTDESIDPSVGDFSCGHADVGSFRFVEGMRLLLGCR